MSEKRDGLPSEPEDIDPDDDLEIEENEELEGVEPVEPESPIEEPEPTKRPGRAERERERRRTVERQYQEEREARIRLEAQLQAARPAQPYVDQAEEARREQEQIALMSPDQIGRYFYEKGQREQRQLLLQMQIQTGDTLDRQGFERFCERHPTANRFAAQVEHVLIAERQQGRNPTRETIARYLLGDELLKRATKETPRQRQRGQHLIEQERTKPTNSRSTVAPNTGRRTGGDSEAEIFERIKDGPLW
jgi:hypothetical protein